MAAAVLASCALAAPVGAAKPQPGVYSWGDNQFKVVDVDVGDDRKTFEFVRVIVQCGAEDDIYFITLDPEGKDAKVKDGKFKIKDKLENLNDESDTKRFTLEGRFTKPRKAPFTLSVAGCGADREGTLKPANV